MSDTVPLIVERDAADFRADIAEKLAANTGWLAADPLHGEPDQASAALIAIVARFGEIAVQRLNQAPEKNFLAFLDLLGAARLAPEPARVPLTFTVTSGSATDAVVPAGTQVAAAPVEGEDAPVIFETERELTAVVANLQTVIAVDADRDLIGDHSALLAAPANEGARVFSGNRANEHVLYIGYSAFLSYAQLASLTLTFQMTSGAPAAPDARSLQWELWDGANGIPLTPVDGTQALRTSGQLAFANLQQCPEQSVNGVGSRWLRCRLLTPVSPGTNAAQGMVRAAQLPQLADIRASAVINRTALAPQTAFANAQAVDVSRAFLPFGDKPRVGDVFYLSQREALGQPGGTITLDVALVSPVPDGVPSADLRLRWETWDGAAWALLGETTPTGSLPGTTLVDGSKALTESGTVSFTLPRTLAATTVNGVEGNWIRVHIVAGNYGVDAFYQKDSSAPGGFTLQPATFAPPFIRSIALSYSVTTPVAAPDAVVSFNNAQFQDLHSALVAGHATPFVGFPAQPPALYYAFTLPPSRKAFPNRTVSLYHGVRLPPYGERVTPLSPELSVQVAVAGNTVQHRFILTNTSAGPLGCDLTTLGGAWSSSVAPAQVALLPGLSTEIKVSVVVPGAGALPAADASDRGFLQLRLSSDAAIRSVAFETRVGEVAPRNRDLRFEYWNGAGWAKLVGADGTERLTHPGVVEFLGPGDFPVSEHFGVRGYWVRALLETGDDPPVQLRTLLPNTTFATQTITLRNEAIGSSDASANQVFTTARSPVLAGAQLEVRETGEWVGWREVADFLGSTAQDRHFVLDRVSGQVSFGDGVQGRIPLRGAGNIRMARYQTGGGSAGNRAAGTIVQLKTTVPYIEKASNVEPAEGGVDAESNADLIARAPRTLRHGGRAVALQDYEDLALAASPEVARAKSVPLRHLQDDPLGNTAVPGAISLIIVPRSTDAKPLPSAGLMTLVEDNLRALSTPTASLSVVGPLYVRVDVSIEVALASLEGASVVEQAVLDVLRQFLHPLTGGRDGTGWDFGRQPQLSDLHAAVSDVRGVDHIRALILDQVEEPQGALGTARFLVYSGQHQITLTYVGAE